MKSPWTRFAVCLLGWHGLLFSGLIAGHGAEPPAATVNKTESLLGLQMSTFEPVKTRDPFAKVSVGISPSPVKPVVVSSSPITLQLDGILYEEGNPSAIVNGRLVTLNKPATLNTPTGEIPVKAVQITRETVVLEINGQRFELQIDPKKPDSDRKR